MDVLQVKNCSTSPSDYKLGSYLRHCRKTVSFAKGWGRKRMFYIRKSLLKMELGSYCIHIHRDFLVHCAVYVKCHFPYKDYSDISLVYLVSTLTN